MLEVARISQRELVPIGSPREAADAAPGTLTSWYAAGFADGLGDRLLLFDNTGGDALEMLRLRPHLTVRPQFEARLRAQAEAVRSFHSASFAPVYSIDRLEDSGGTLAIVSGHISGVRLSEVLSHGAHGRRPLSIEAAVSIISQLVHAVATFQAHRPGLVHGALGPERVVLTGHGRVVVVEHALGAALAEIGYDQERFWTELRVGTMAAGAGAIDSRTDVLQIGLVALATILGRNLTASDFPHGVDNLLSEVEGILEGAGQYSSASVRQWLERALQASASGSFRSAVEAANTLSDWNVAFIRQPTTRPQAMYERFYGLRERPFDLTPNPKYLLLTKTHREALDNLEYGISAGVGVTVLIGEAGTGKTTLIRTAMTRADAAAGGSPTTWAYLKNPTLSRSEFLQFLAERFGLPPDAAISKTRLLDDLERVLGEGRRAALIVDEAQSVPLHLFEEIRLLANLESDTEKLLPVVLVGQPEFANRLNEPALRQLKQRVALRCTLAPLSLSESAAYIAGRIAVAGGDPRKLFSREAVKAIHKSSGGIPRTINVICENALLTGCAGEQRPVGEKLIATVCRDFDLSQNPAKPSRAGANFPPPSPPDTSNEAGPTAARATLAERVRRWGLRRHSS